MASMGIKFTPLTPYLPGSPPPRTQAAPSSPQHEKVPFKGLNFDLNIILDLVNEMHALETARRTAQEAPLAQQTIIDDAVIESLSSLPQEFSLTPELEQMVPSPSTNGELGGAFPELTDDELSQYSVTDEAFAVLEGFLTTDQVETTLFSPFDNTFSDAVSKYLEDGSQSPVLQELLADFSLHDDNDLSMQQ